MKYRVLASLVSPLSISSSPSVGNVIETLKHIPGSVWRGAFAARLMREIDGHAPEKDPWFRQCFLESKMRFGDLRLRGSSPWPLSARRCRRDTRAPHSEVDFLLSAGMGNTLIEECAHIDCGSKLERPRSFLTRDGHCWKEASVKTRMSGHTAVDPWTLRAADGQLFQTNLMERGQIFSGELWVDDAVAAEHDIEREFTADRIVLGRGGTRGQGHVSLSVSRNETPDAARERELLTRLTEMNRLWPNPGEVVFSCTLLSPCLVLDEWLLARSYPAVHDLEEACGNECHGALDGYALIAQFSQWVTVAGWNGQAGLPKSDTQAIAAGSAFLYRKSIGDADRDAEIARLATLLSRVECGIGEKWEEGFGEATFCHEYHCDPDKLAGAVAPPEVAK